MKGASGRRLRLTSKSLLRAGKRGPAAWVAAQFGLQSTGVLTRINELRPKFCRCPDFGTHMAGQGAETAVQLTREFSKRHTSSSPIEFARSVVYDLSP